MSTDRPSIDHSLELYLEEIRRTPELAIEFEASIAEFYGGPPPVTGTRETMLAARRHLEWFVLERHSPTIGARPAEALFEARRSASVARDASAGEADQHDGEATARALFDSFAGIFEVSGIETGRGAWLRDLAGLGEYPIVDESAHAALAVGDVVMGRLFPLGSGEFSLSRAAGIHRDEELKSALVADIERARESSSASKVMRVSQRHLEAMFWPAQTEAVEEPVDPRPAVREFFRANGFDDAHIDSLFELLARRPIDQTRWVVGAGDALGELLDELAFETDIDLERAREGLVAVWTWFSREREARLAPGAKRREPSGRSSEGRSGSASGVATEEADPGVLRPVANPSLERDRRRAALEAFDHGRARGADLEQLFQALESELALEPGETAGDDGAGAELDAPAAEDGVIEQIVDEFLWERGLEESERELRRYRGLRALARFARTVPALEDLGEADLRRFSCFWLLEERTLASAEEATEMVDALSTFCHWCEEDHCVPLEAAFGETLSGLRQSLPRIVEANRALGRGALDPTDTGKLYWVRACDDGRARLVDPDGEEREVLLPRQLRPLLQAGDGLRGRVQIDDSLSVYCCYPPEARAIAE